MASNTKSNISSALNSLNIDVYKRSASVELDKLRQDADSSIDDVINNSIMGARGQTPTELYNRAFLHDKKNSLNKKDLDEFENAINNSPELRNVIDTALDGKYIKQYDNQIDMILRHMPQLKDILNIRKNNILSVDVTNKTFAVFTNNSSTNNEKMDEMKFQELSNIYGLQEVLEKAFEYSDKYGEAYVLTMPYSKAFKDLMNMRSKITNNVVQSYSENYTTKSVEENSGDTFSAKNNIVTVKLKFSKSKFPQSILKENSYIINSKISEAYNIPFKELNESTNMIFNEADNTTTKELKFDMSKFVSADGFVDKNEKPKDITNDTFKDIKGCVVDQLERNRVFPIYINNMCIGYYYIEVEEVEKTAEDLAKRRNNYFSNRIESMKSLSGENRISGEEDLAIKKLASTVSKAIDTEFINANQDISKEIYTILKYEVETNGRHNNAFRVSFIEPKYMNHIYSNKDSKTHRGISALHDSYLPAALYCSLYINFTIGIMTRGFDKRAYFVKQAVDTNISHTLINTIQQIKLSNFGMRDFNNLDMMFNNIGMFVDMLISTNGNGDKPIDFEVIQGQDIDTKNDFMDRLESMAVRPLEVPIELVDALKNVDYATRLSMANIRFLRFVIKMQSIYERHFSKLVSNIYNFHYGENENITVKLPTPVQLLIDTMGDLWNNASDFVEKCVELSTTREEQDNEEFIRAFKLNLMKYYLSSSVDWDVIERLKRQSELEAKVKEKDDDNNNGY